MEDYKVHWWTVKTHLMYYYFLKISIIHSALMIFYNDIQKCWNEGFFLNISSRVYVCTYFASGSSIVILYFGVVLVVWYLPCFILFPLVCQRILEMRNI